MGARFVLVDVFAREPLAGNALAVFPDPGSVDAALMQKIARETNLSETTFVTALDGRVYDLRIFTPYEEMPFAGHPTLGTAWTLRYIGAVSGEEIVQRTAAGETPVTFEGDRVWFERGGDAGADLEDIDDLVTALELDPGWVGFDAAALGGASADLRPAIASAGIPVLMMPIDDPERVARLRVPTSVPAGIDGVYCFAPLGRGRIKARFFGPGFGISEDPATGGAAAALGLYLGGRAGDLEVEIEQGIEVARPSFISLRAAPGKTTVGGTVHVAGEGSLL